MKPWYIELFEDFSNNYEQQPFVKGTINEVDFLENEINFDKKMTILDIGCGTGRHSIELSKRGYTVAGTDISFAQLKKAQENAARNNLSVNWFRSDARYLSLKRRFDLVLMICEGAFPLMETDEMNFAILEKAAAALKKSGKLVFTTLNGLFPIFNSVKDYIDKRDTTGINKTDTFDLLTFRDISEFEFTDDSGNKKKLKCNERYYIPSEITWMLKTLGLSKIDFMGAETGNWKRNKPLTTSDFEMLVVAGF